VQVVLPQRVHAWRDPDLRQQDRRDDECQAVDRERPTGTQHDDDHAPDGRAEDAHGTARETLKGIGLLQPTRGHGLRDEADLGGDDETVAGAPQGAEQCEGQHGRVAGEDRDRHRRLRRALQERGTHEDSIAP
jgi:hypothetical protein